MKEEIKFTMGLRGGVFREAHPRYSELSLECERDTGEMAFGQSLSGTLKFIDTDYDWIMSQERGVEILVTATRGTIVFFGKFVITDCEINDDNRVVEVELEADDPYTWLKDHYDDTFNLVALAPKNEIIEYRRRAAWEFYRQGDTKLSVVMGGDYFELDATQTASHTTLIDTYHFGLVGVEVSIAPSFISYGDEIRNEFNNRIFKAAGLIGSDGYLNLYSAGTKSYLRVKFSATNSNIVDGVIVYYANTAGVVSELPIGTLKAQSSSHIDYEKTDVGIQSAYFYYHASATSTRGAAYITGMYARVVHNNASESSKYTLPTEDIVTKTLNYNYVSVPTPGLVNLVANNDYSAEATEWGLAPDNTNYYKKPTLPSAIDPECPLYPVGKTTWGEYSWWTYFDFSSETYDNAFWNAVQLKDAYPLASVLSVLLDAIFTDSGYKVTFDETTAASGFFYGDYAGYLPTPPKVYITPKTNVLTSNYSQKAQKGDITIGNVLDMLRDVFRCYWFIERQSDGTFRLRVEQVFWFYNGGSYETSGGTPYDIRNAKDPRTGKYWEYGKAKFSFDTSELYSRYEFGWQDECTDYFDGDAVTCLAKYVNGSATNKAEIKAFTSDLDYMLLNPEEFSKDGFALLGATDRQFLMYDVSETQTWTLSGASSVQHTFAAGAIAGDTEAYVVRSQSGTTIGLRFMSKAGTQLGTAATTKNGDKVTIPAGAAYVLFIATAAVTTTLYFVSAHPQVDIPAKGVYGCAPQNYRLSFKYAARNWYEADYPCRNIAFGDGANRVTADVPSYLPVKKAMKQELGLPFVDSFDPYKGVLSTKGTALVNKYTINLLTLFQELTLMYGTDE